MANVNPPPAKKRSVETIGPDLAELMQTRKAAYFTLVDARQQVEDADYAIKRALISMGATEALTIQWGKLRRMTEVVDLTK